MEADLSLPNQSHRWSDEEGCTGDVVADSKVIASPERLLLPLSWFFCWGVLVT